MSRTRGSKEVHGSRDETARAARLGMIGKTAVPGTDKAVPDQPMAAGGDARESPGFSMRRCAASPIRWRASRSDRERTGRLKHLARSRQLADRHGLYSVTDRTGRYLLSVFPILGSKAGPKPDRCRTARSRTRRRKVIPTPAQGALHRRPNRSNQYCYATSLGGDTHHAMEVRPRDRNLVAEHRPTRSRPSPAKWATAFGLPPQPALPLPAYPMTTARIARLYDRSRNGHAHGHRDRRHIAGRFQGAAGRRRPPRQPRRAFSLRQRAQSSTLAGFQGRRTRPANCRRFGRFPTEKTPRGLRPSTPRRPLSPFGRSGIQTR